MKTYEQLTDAEKREAVAQRLDQVLTTCLGLDEYECLEVAQEDAKRAFYADLHDVVIYGVTSR